MSATLPRAGRLRRFLPRYSLRSLFIFVALVSVALAWWQRPYEEDVTESGRRTVRTVRRNLFGPPIPEGPEIEYDAEGHKLRETHWSNGMLNGPELAWGTYTGELVNQGQWVQGRKEGTWNSWKRDGFFEFPYWDSPDDSIPGIDAFYKRDILSEQREYLHDTLIRITRFPTSHYSPSQGSDRAEVESLEVGEVKDESILTRYIAFSENLTSWSRFPRSPSWLPKVEQIHFRGGLRDGLAEGWNDGESRYVGHWKGGRADGEWTLQSYSLTYSLTFRDGSLYAVDGRIVDNFARRAPATDDNEIRRELVGRLATTVEDHYCPDRQSLQHWVAHLRKAHGVKLQVDYRIWFWRPPRSIDNYPWTIAAPRRKIEGMRRLGCGDRGIPLGAHIFLVAEANDLACVWRYGQLWLTTKESAQAWRDLTGIELLQIDSDGEDKPEIIREKVRDEPISLIASLVSQGFRWHNGAWKANGRLPMSLDFVGTRAELVGAVLDQTGMCFAKGEGDELVLRPQYLGDN